MSPGLIAAAAAASAAVRAKSRRDMPRGDFESGLFAKSKLLPGFARTFASGKNEERGMWLPVDARRETTETAVRSQQFDGVLYLTPSSREGFCASGVYVYASIWV